MEGWSRECYDNEGVVFEKYGRTGARLSSCGIARIDDAMTRRSKENSAIMRIQNGGRNKEKVFERYE